MNDTSRIRQKNGTLYLTGTPIGNLEDVSFRVIRILQEADLIAAEDTRYTRKLLSHYDIHSPLTSYHEHNEEKKAPYIIKKIKEGNNVALVTRAGMPGISDPGYTLVKTGIKEGIRMVPVPGPTALILALVISGFPTDSFVFEGFLGRSRKVRRKKLINLNKERRTIVLYESPHRLQKVLPEIREILGDRRAVIARELTKKFEEIIRGTLSEIEEVFQKKKPRGEFTLVIEGAG